MSELDPIVSQVSDLRREVAGLRRQRWITLALAGCALLLFSARSATTQAPPPDLVCRSLKVVGPDGKERANIGIDADGGLITVRDKEGRARVYLGLDANGGLLDLKGSDGTTRSWMGVGKKGGIVDVRGNDGKVKTIMTTHDEGHGGYIGVRGNDDNYRSVMSADATGGVINLRGNDGKSRLVAGVGANDAGEFDLRMPDEKIRVIARVRQGVGSVETLDGAGNIRAKIP